MTPTVGVSPTVLPWPAGWDIAFCTTFVDIVVAQELARDIGRALDESVTEDAIGLTHELGTTVEGIRTGLADLPEWPGAAALVTALGAMLDADDQLATFYLRYLEEGRAGALDRAHEVEATLREDAVPAAEAALAPLVGDGLTCPETNLMLEKP